MSEVTDFCKQHNACRDGAEWAKQHATLAESTHELTNQVAFTAARWAGDEHVAHAAQRPLDGSLLVW